MKYSTAKFLDVNLFGLAKSYNLLVGDFVVQKKTIIPEILNSNNYEFRKRVTLTLLIKQ